MRQITALITGLGDVLLSLSDRARRGIVFSLLVLLGGSGIYKLIVSIERLTDPLPAATPEQLIKPMEKLFEGTKNDANRYQQTRRIEMNKLDSLAKRYSPH